MNDDEAVKRLKNSLDALGKAEMKTPDLLFMANLVNSEKKRIAFKLNRQFAAFIAVSFFIVAGVLLCLFKNLFLFAIVEAVPFIAISVALIIKKRASDRG